MNFTEYQNEAIKTAMYPEAVRVLYPSLGLAGETGEVCEKIKKVYRDNNGVFTDEKRIEITKEIGDVLWYLASICNDLSISLDDAANMNIAKLASRKERGVLSGSGDNR